MALNRTRAADKGLTYAEALEEALCFGWIDGVRRSLDGESFGVRFTPRKPKSVWSAVNIRKAMRLATLIECSAKRERIPLLARGGRKGTDPIAAIRSE